MLILLVLYLVVSYINFHGRTSVLNDLSVQLDYYRLRCVMLNF